MKLKVYMRLSAAACLIALTQSAQAAPPVTVDGIYAAAAADCAKEGNGVFSPGTNPVTKADLTGDGKPEQIVDMASFECSTLASFYGGTGGAPIAVLADGKRWDWTALGFQVVQVEYAPPVLLMAVHGGACGATGGEPCYDAVVWNGETFLSVSPAQ